MTKELARQYYQDFEHDPVVFKDPSNFTPYVYSEARADAYFDKQIRLGREYLAILVESVPVGEIILKNIDISMDIKLLITVGYMKKLFLKII